MPLVAEEIYRDGVSSSLHTGYALFSDGVFVGVLSTYDVRDANYNGLGFGEKIFGNLGRVIGGLGVLGDARQTASQDFTSNRGTLLDQNFFEIEAAYNDGFRNFLYDIPVRLQIEAIEAIAGEIVGAFPYANFVEAALAAIEGESIPTIMATAAGLDVLTEIFSLSDFSPEQSSTIWVRDLALEARFTRTEYEIATDNTIFATYNSTLPFTPIEGALSPSLNTEVFEDASGVSNPLLTVGVRDQTIQVGESIAVSTLFPSYLWTDADGSYDITAFAIQDRTVGGGYLEVAGVRVPEATVYEFPIADLTNWRFVAADGAAVDEIGFNVIQADGDFSTRLTPGAQVTTITRPPDADDDPAQDPTDAVAIIDIDNHEDGDEFVEDRSARFTIERRGSLDGDVELAWRVFGIGDNPADASDFVTTSGTITIRDGRDERTLTIALTDDSIFEQDERFGIDLDIISGNAEFSDDDEQATILNDDILPPWGTGTDDHGNTLNAATFVSGEQWVQGFIETSGDVDWFRYDLRGGGSYRFSIDGDNDTSKIDDNDETNAPALTEDLGQLWSDNGTLIGTLVDRPGTLGFPKVFEIDLENEPDQTVYLSARENGDNDVGQYFVKMQVRIEPDDLPADITTPANLASGDVYYGFHERNEDDDWVRVDLLAGETYRFAAVDEDRLLFENPDGANGRYYFGWDEPTLRLYDANGGFVAQQNASFPAFNNLLQYTVSTSGTYYLSISDDGGERIRDWALLFDDVPTTTPDSEVLVLQGADVTTDVRFTSTRDLNRVATDDGILTTGDDTSSALRFDIDGLPEIATYAAIELFLTETSYEDGRTSDIVVDAPGDTWTTASLFGEVGDLELITVNPAQSVGSWVTIPITELYNKWQSGEKENNGIALTPSFLSGPRLTFHSSDADVDPALMPRLVIQGPGIGAEVTGTFTAEMSEDDRTVSGAISITSAFLPDVSFSEADARGRYGAIAVNATGDTWTFTPFDTVQTLDAGETVQETLTITATNGVAQQITITVRGEDDPAFFVGTTNVSVTTSAGIGEGGLSLFDIDGDDDPVFLARSYSGSRGTLVFDTTGDWIYTVEESDLAGLSLGDTVQEVFDVAHSLGSDTFIISLLVDTEINTNPMADAETFELAVDSPLRLATATLLEGDTDADGDTLTVVSVSNAVNGTVNLDDKGDADASNDEVIFNPTQGYVGPASFQYTLSDGNGGTDVGTVDIAIGPRLVITVGGGGSDIRGSDGDDTLSAAAGSNTINGTAGSDLIAGGLDNDVLFGADGNDILLGDLSRFIAGADRLTGGTGNDLLEGGLGADVFIFNTNDGNDTIGRVALDYDNPENTTVAGTDFVSGVDTIELRGFGLADTADAYASVTDVDGVATFFDQGTMITFAGLTVADLSADDFLVL